MNVRTWPLGALPLRAAVLLSLVAALLLAHGLQCSGANASSAGSVSKDDRSAHALHSGAALTSLAAKPVMDTSTTQTVEAAGTDAREAGATTAGGAPAPVPHLPGHLVQVCFALLLGGLALVAAAWFVRGRHVRPGRSPWPARRTMLALRRALPPAPPDLSRLCVLRT